MATPRYDRDEERWGPTFLLMLGLIAAAVAASVFVFNGDDTPSSTLVTNVAAEATATPQPEATPEPASTPTPEPAATPEATPEPAPAPAPITVVDVAANDGRFGSLASALGSTGLIETLQGDGPFTVFAPTDDAFANIDISQLDEAQLRTVLLHHVVEGELNSSDLMPGQTLTALSGEPITVGDQLVLDGVADIIETDLDADNGLVHVISGVLVPPSLQPKGNVFELLANDEQDRFSVLTSALEAEGLDEVLAGDGPFTVFAPTNGAFDELGDAGAVILANADRVLTYHVVGGALVSSELATESPLATVEGEAIEISRTLVLNDFARIGEPDLLADNGVVHVIDGVLVPPSLQTEISLNQLFALDPVQFAVGSAQILPQSEEILDQAVAILSASDSGDVTIEGHTDTDGEDEANLALSTARANSVLDYLVAGGVDTDRLNAVGFGETQLAVDPEVTPEDKQANRRIEFRVAASG